MGCFPRTAFCVAVVACGQGGCSDETRGSTSAGANSGSSGTGGIGGAASSSGTGGIGGAASSSGGNGSATGSGGNGGGGMGGSASSAGGNGGATGSGGGGGGSPVVDCTGHGDFTFCVLDTTASFGVDYSYDICVQEVCISPGACGDATCNVPGPHFPVPKVAAGNSFTRTEPLAGEPVVEDAVTGLVWQGCVAGLSGSLCAAGSPMMLPWFGALAYCDALSWGGDSDWYLPDPWELASLVRYGTALPVDTSAFPATTTTSTWTSASSPMSVGGAFWVDFATGAVNTFAKTATSVVRCVRRGPASIPSRFVRTEPTAGQPIVEDKATGLVWQGCAAGLDGSACGTGAAAKLDAAAAASLCSGLSWEATATGSSPRPVNCTRLSTCASRPAPRSIPPSFRPRPQRGGTGRRRRSVDRLCRTACTSPTASWTTEALHRCFRSAASGRARDGIDGARDAVSPALRLNPATGRLRRLVYVHDGKSAAPPQESD